MIIEKIIRLVILIIYIRVKEMLDGIVFIVFKIFWLLLKFYVVVFLVGYFFII